uniref:Lipopolysaccharide kinase (Kdo/WaaP) family protein n=1 Tax=Candidatus Kentrum sp. FM TaxID=2126340 RepID=A0A450TKH6_9GAMM|nr:MAG: Lipopolysaccharide kinase (Kdo/WaaP) family protein [Candidatus Kentron sp. FM]VFJ68954.1 MAG: Lipopolysaccharide kinase (Kdo/WaaP) family protein [Candidatus Kentron sp. FM]VFK18454.1 MAG: Lipopolysaccharide kinase (Kdo/WaaP) family protein [Candidatus Kentron sp. FM]
MTEYIDGKYLGLLRHHHLHTFDALWSVVLEEVDSPNKGRGGWSTVSRLTLADERGTDKDFFVKRQCNYLCRPWQHPLGEPTFSREFRNIKLYDTFGLPTVEVAYFAWRKSPEGPRAILVTRALEQYRPLTRFFASWHKLDPGDQKAILEETGSLIGRLHACRLSHHCLYPKHVFIALGQPVPVRLIDLEKAGPQWFPKREALSEMNRFLRRIGPWSSEERRLLFRHYLIKNPIFPSVDRFCDLLALRGAGVSGQRVPGRWSALRNMTGRA